jgi:hypothetical protein
VKLVLGSLTVIVLAGPLEAVKPSVYVADAPATSGEAVKVTLFTDEPKLTVFVISWGPTGAPLAAVVGVINTAIFCVAAGGIGFTPEATMLMVPPTATAVVSVRATPPVIAVTVVTASVAAVPPGGVYVTV